MQSLHPNLVKLRQRIGTKTNPKPELAIESAFNFFEDYLLDIGAVLIQNNQYGEKLYVLPFGLIGDTYWWVEFSVEEESHNRLVVCLVSTPLPIDREDKPEYLELIASSVRGQEGCHTQLIDKANTLTQLDSILDRAFQFINRVSTDYALAMAGADRLRNHLTGLGYCVTWDAEVAYDLERVTVLTGATERRYYVDSIEQIASAAGGIYFKDALGRGIVVSHGSGYIVEPLTFRSVEELAAESPSLVLNCVKLITGFTQRLIPGFSGFRLFYNPDSKLTIAHQFMVPVPSIAESLKPVLEVGGI